MIPIRTLPYFEVIELEVDEGQFASGLAYANIWLQPVVDPMNYVGRRVLVVPGRRTKRKGTQGRSRINSGCLNLQSNVGAGAAGRKRPLPSLHTEVSQHHTLEIPTS